MWSWLGGQTPQRTLWDPLADGGGGATAEDVQHRQQQFLEALHSPNRMASVSNTPNRTPIRRELNSPSSFAAASPSSQMNFRDYSALVDFRHLETRLPQGMYVSPSTIAGQETSLWNGILFPKMGPFLNGVFRFEIHLDNYPMECPKIKFLTRIYHPLVSPSTGWMELSHFFPEWIPQRNRVWHVLQSVSSCLSQPSLAPLEKPVPYNDANQILQKDPNLFGVLAAQCVSESQLAMNDILEGRAPATTTGFEVCRFEPSMLTNALTGKN